MKIREIKSPKKFMILPYLIIILTISYDTYYNVDHIMSEVLSFRHSKLQLKLKNYSSKLIVIKAPRASITSI